MSCLTKTQILVSYWTKDSYIASSVYKRGLLQTRHIYKHHWCQKDKKILTWGKKWLALLYYSYTDKDPRKGKHKGQNITLQSKVHDIRKPSCITPTPSWVTYTAYLNVLEMFMILY